MAPLGLYTTFKYCCFRKGLFINLASALKARHTLRLIQSVQGSLRALIKHQTCQLDFQQLEFRHRPVPLQ